MTYLLKLYLVLLLINLSASKNLLAEENSYNIFYSNTWQRAWDDCPTDPIYETREDGSTAICFPCDTIILARLEIWNYWFAPHPFQNRFHDTLLEIETSSLAKDETIKELREKLKAPKRRNLAFFLAGTGTGAAVVVSVVVLVVRLVK